MRIAHITCVWPPYCGGVGVAASEQAGNLAKLGHDVTVFTPAYHGHKPHTEVWQGVKVVFLRPWLWYGNAAFIPALYRQLKNFDIIHLQLYFIGSTYFIIKAAKQQRIPLFVQYQNDLLGKGWRKFLFRWYTKLVLPKIINSAHTVITLSSEHAQASDLGQFIRAGKLNYKIIPNGVDTNLFKPGPKDISLSKALNISPNEHNLLFVGGIDQAHYFKGLEYILQAVADLHRQGLRPVLLVVGGGELLPKFKKLAQDLGIANYVRWLGAITHTNLPPYYCLANIFVSASYETESFSIVNIEAMACGIPVVTTDLPGPREVVGEAGVIVPRQNSTALAKVLTDLLSNQQWRDNLASNGRLRVEHYFSWPKIVEELLTLYKLAVK